MAFTYTVTGRISLGNLVGVWGTYTSAGGSEGGNIYTSLGRIEFLVPVPNDTSVEASAPVVNETFPCSDPVTIVTIANEEGYWFAFGYN